MDLVIYQGNLTSDYQIFFLFTFEEISVFFFHFMMCQSIIIHCSYVYKRKRPNV